MAARTPTMSSMSATTTWAPRTQRTIGLADVRAPGALNPAPAHAFLANVPPTPEQLSLLSLNRPGVEIISGAAGSGKTTTALLRLGSTIGVFENQRRSDGNAAPIRALVLTYNRTLRGYIEAPARDQAAFGRVELEISTFSKWALHQLGRPTVIQDSERRAKLQDLGSGIRLPARFLLDEVDYVQGRFLPND